MIGNLAVVCVNKFLIKLISIAKENMFVMRKCHLCSPLEITIYQAVICLDNFRYRHTLEIFQVWFQTITVK